MSKNKMCLRCTEKCKQYSYITILKCPHYKKSEAKIKKIAKIVSNLLPIQELQQMMQPIDIKEVKLDLSTGVL